MPPHEGLVHLKEYDVKDSNVELIGSEIDHQVKYNSATTEPAWNDGKVGRTAGLFVWRIEEFQVIPWPKEKYGQFYDGDSYIVLYAYKVGDKDGQEKLVHEIFFWLGSKTSQDEAGTAAYKTVELDEFLHGIATQHREIQQQPSREFIALFPRITIRSGGVKSGFRHVDTDAKPEETLLLLRVFKHPAAPRADSVMVYEVQPTWQSLDDGDVFILDKGNKIWVWQGKNCTPMEKAKAAQVVHDLTLAKHIDVEVLSQNEPRSRVVVGLLGGKEVEATSFQSSRPISPPQNAQDKSSASPPTHKLFRISDATGQLSFDLVKDSQSLEKTDLDSNDIFLVDAGSSIWVWEGSGASRVEKASWLKVAQWYIRQIQDTSDDRQAYLTPISKVVENNESKAFLKALAV